MATESIRVSTWFSVSPERIYKAWLSSDQHSKMTGGAATIEPLVGGHHSAWDGYIQGQTIQLEPNRRIVQTWRTSEFPPNSPSSKLDVILDPAPGGGTRVVLEHTGIPEGQGASYERGWFDHYFTPMTTHFAEGSAAGSDREECGDAWLVEQTPLPSDDEDTATDDYDGSAIAEALAMTARRTTRTKRARPTASKTGRKTASTKAPAKKRAAKKAAKTPATKARTGKAAAKAPAAKAAAKTRETMKKVGSKKTGSRLGAAHTGAAKGSGKAPAGTRTSRAAPGKRPSKKGAMD